MATKEEIEKRVNEQKAAVQKLGQLTKEAREKTGTLPKSNKSTQGAGK